MLWAIGLIGTFYLFTLVLGFGARALVTGDTFKQIAESKGIKVGDEMLDYLLDQVVEIFHHSHNVDEIFAEDVVLRRKMAPIFKRYIQVDDSLDAEVRAQMKHVREGSSMWDVEYARIMEQVKRKKGLA